MSLVGILVRYSLLKLYQRLAPMFLPNFIMSC